MSAADEIAVWLRYYDRRASEGFGPMDIRREDRRQRVLNYIREQSMQAYAVIVGEAA